MAIQHGEGQPQYPLALRGEGATGPHPPYSLKMRHDVSLVLRRVYTLQPMRAWARTIGVWPRGRTLRADNRTAPIDGVVYQYVLDQNVLYPLEMV
jgi:hypothetical protein